MTVRFLKTMTFTVMIAAVTICILPHQASAGGPQDFYKGKPAKYVFFFIGDGMAQPQRTSTEMYLAAREGKPHGAVKLSMSKLPAQGMITTHAANSIIPDSSDTATAMACGIKTNSGMLGVNPENKAYKSVAEMAKAKGMKLGIITTVSLDHATPGAFYAHQEHRGKYHEISHQLVMSGFDFFAGGDFLDPDGKKSKEPKGNVKDLAKEKGYKIVNTKEEILKLKKGDGPVIAINERLQDSKSMPYAMDRDQKDLNLADFVAKAIEMLEGPEGFFIMTEGGKIDWACHANDAVASITDIIDLDKCVDVALKFHEKHPDETLTIVGGDHETGGLTIGFAGTQYASYYHVLEGQKVSQRQFTDKLLKGYKNDCGSACKFEDVKPMITQYFGLKFEGDAKKDRQVLQEYEIKKLEEAFNRSLSGEEEKSKDPVVYLLYGGYDPLAIALTQILNHKAGLGWTTYSHTGLPVAISAIGVGSETFNGLFDNTDVAKKLMAVMGMNPEPQLVLK